MIEPVVNERISTIVWSTTTHREPIEIGVPNVFEARQFSLWEKGV